MLCFSKLHFIESVGFVSEAPFSVQVELQKSQELPENLSAVKNGFQTKIINKIVKLGNAAGCA